MPSSSNDVFKLENLFSVKGKVALVTGAGTGIGLMITQAFAVNGAKVYIVGRTKEKLDKVVELYGKDISGEIVPIAADITSKEQIKSLIKQISDKESHLDILVNNAGVELNSQTTEAESAKEFMNNVFNDENETMDTWTDTYRTNVAQLFFMTTGFLPLIQKSTEHHKGYSGTVINISSISGIVRSAQHHFAYNASKAAAIHLTTMLSAEVAGNNLKVRINSIAPGVFPSEMTAGDSGNDQKSHIPKEEHEGKTPANRPGKEEDMGSAALFCATNQFLNGQTVVVDGGYVISVGGGA